jgi:putative transcriptional regulator
MRYPLINRVKELREGINLTQKELGEKVNVSRQAINAIETNKFDPFIWLAYDLAVFFHQPIENLFNFKESDRK